MKIIKNIKNIKLLYKNYKNYKHYKNYKNYIDYNNYKNYTNYKNHKNYKNYKNCKNYKNYKNYKNIKIIKFKYSLCDVAVPVRQRVGRSAENIAANHAPVASDPNQDQMTQELKPMGHTPHDTIGVLKSKKRTSHFAASFMRVYAAIRFCSE